MNTNNITSDDRDLLIETFKSMDNYANAAMRGMMYLNGGAAILWSNLLWKIFGSKGSFWPLIFFGFGVVFAVAAFGFASISQRWFMEKLEAKLANAACDEEKRKAKLWKSSAFCATILSVLCFFAGIISSYAGLSPTAAKP